MSEKINKLYITSGEATLLVESENSAILSDLQNEAFVRSHIPSAIISTETLEKVDASLLIKNSEQFDVILKYPDVVCFQPEKVDTRGVIALMGYILERANNEKGVYSVHSSVITKNNKAIVLFGGTTNLGKTSIAKIASEKFAWSFYSDEMALIDSNDGKIIAGGKIVTNSDSFDDFNLPETKETFEIIGFVHPHIDNGLNKFEKWNSDKFFWHLKEELARKIRGGSKAIHFFSYPLGSLDTFDIASKRLLFAKNLSEKIPCYEMRGDPEYIGKQITEIFK